MGDRPGGLFFDPNTGDDMVDKDDLFQEEDETNPQDQDRDEPSSDEDDDIIDLLDTVEIAAEDMEEDIIELADTVEAADDGNIELTEKSQGSVVDEDVLDLTEVVTDENELEDDILELTDIAAADDAQDDGVLDLTQKIEASDVEDEIIDLTEAAAEDDVISLLDTVEMPAQDMTKDVLEPADSVQETESEDGDDIIDLTEAAAEDDVISLLDTVEMPAQDMTKDILEPADIAQEADPDVDDDIFDPSEAMADFDSDAAAMELTEPDEADETMEADEGEGFQETVALPSQGYEEDKELLALIDDIQATLNDEPAAARVSDQEDIPQPDESIEVDTPEEDTDAYTFLDDDEIIENGDVPESETEFVDHLGIDLTSEIERKALEESQEAVMEDVKPIENLESDIAPGSLETAVKKALTEMLADENNPLAKAIENAVKKALGQGADT
jgi:hypothetical protein